MRAKLSTLAVCLALVAPQAWLPTEEAPQPRGPAQPSASCSCVLEAWRLVAMDA